MTLQDGKLGTKKQTTEHINKQETKIAAIIDRSRRAKRIQTQLTDA